MAASQTSGTWRLVAIVFAAYVVALLFLPSDFGLATAVGVISPSRALLLLAIALSAMDALHDRSRPSLPDRRVVIAWVLFLLLAFASNLTSAYGPSWARFGSLVLEGTCVAWLSWRIASVAAASVETTLVGATALLAGVVTVMSVIGLRYDLIFSGASSAGGLRFGVVRQEASFDSPLFYAVWLVAASALAAGIATAGSGRRRTLAIVAWAIIAGAVVTTASRFAMIAVPVVLGVVLASGRRMKPAAGSVVAAAAIALVFLTGPGGFSDAGGLDAMTAIVSPPPSSGQGAGGGVNPGSEGPASNSSGPATPAPTLSPQDAALRGSTAARFEAIRLAASAATARPLLGWGLLSAKRVSLEYLGHVNYVDNTYLVVLIEQGAAGLLSLAALLLVTLAASWPARGVLRISQVLAPLSILAFGLVAAVLATTQGYALFWLTAGLAMGGATASAASGARREAVSS